MERVPTQDPATVATAPAAPLALSAPSAPRARAWCSKRVLAMSALAAAALACFAGSLALDLYIRDTDDWIDWLGWKRTETGDIYLSGVGRPIVEYTRDSELTITSVFGTMLNLTALLVLASTIRVARMPVCRWKAEGYAEPPHSLGRIIMPSVYHLHLRDYNVQVSTSFIRLWTAQYEEKYDASIAYNIVALENFDFFWPVLSPRELLHEILTKPSGDHLFGAVTFMWTTAVQIGLVSVIFRELGALDLNAENPNQVRVPENQTTWWEYPPAGENARRASSALLSAQGIFVMLMIQFYAFVALGELSEKGYCWKRFDWFKEERFGGRIFNTWPGPKNSLWHEFNLIGMLTYDISDLPLGGEPRAHLILPPWMTRRDDAKPANTKFTQLWHCYTKQAIDFFQCEWWKLASTLQTPEWRAEDLCQGKRCPSKSEWIYYAVQAGKSQESLYDKKGELVFTPHFAYGEPVTPALLRSCISEANADVFKVVVLWWALVTMYTGEQEFVWFCLAHLNKFEGEPFVTDPCSDPAYANYWNTTPPFTYKLTLRDTLIINAVLFTGIGVSIGLIAAADRFTEGLIPSIVIIICTTMLIIGPLEELFHHLGFRLGVTGGSKKSLACPAQTLKAQQKWMASGGGTPRTM